MKMLLVGVVGVLAVQALLIGVLGREWTGPLYPESR